MHKNTLRKHTDDGQYQAHRIIHFLPVCIDIVRPVQLQTDFNEFLCYLQNEYTVLNQVGKYSL